MNTPDLLALLAYWQKALRLLDWRIAIEYVPDLRSRDGTPCYGLCFPFADNKTARILVRDPATPLDDRRSPASIIEETIIHELLHLHFAPFGGRRPAEITVEEQAVWAIAEALISKKGTGQELSLSRAMIGALSHSQLSALAARRAARRTGMDPLIIAALEAALEAEDPKAAIQALLEKIKAAGGETAPPAEDMAQAAPDDPQKPPMAQAQGKPGMCRKGAPSPVVRSASAAPSQVELPAEVRAQLDGLDAFKRDFLLGQKGNLLPETQRRWAATQPYDVVKGLLDATPELPTERRSARPSTPTKGAAAGGSSSSGEYVDGIVDRRMGVAREETPAVMVDPNTNKLFITATRPVTVGVMK
jgi:hypothetical protein